MLSKIDLQPEITPLARFFISDPRGATLKLLPCRIPLRPSDTSPKIVEELAVGLPTEGRERYVRPTSARIKGATLCLHFTRGVPGT